MRWDRLKKKPYRIWGLFNYDTLYEVGRTRKDCREHAARILGDGFERYFRDGSIQIRKITVREGW
jgi:hypothetical protein